MARRNFFESNNPMMKDDVYRRSQAQPNVLDSDMVRTESSYGTMTVQGAVNKTMVLGLIMLATALLSAYFVMATGSPVLMYVGFVGVIVVSFIANRNIEKASLWSKVFAVMEGLAVGGVSLFYGMAYGGIVFQAVLITLAILFTMLMLFKTGVIKVTERFRNIIMTAMGGIMIVYLVEFVLHMFGIDVPFLHDQSMIGVGISLLIVGVASFKLLVDFDNFERGEQFNAPKYMEWYFGMGLLFTLVWLYMEILYLLSAFMGSD